MDVTKAQAGSDTEVSRHVAETAERLHNRLAELASGMHSFLEAKIPELRGDERVTELFAPSVEGNIDRFCVRCATASTWNASRPPLRRSSMPGDWHNTGCRSTRWFAPIGLASG